MKNFKKIKLNSKGFGHVELLVVLVGILTIGAIGSYVYLRSSHAATITQTQCKNQGGVWLDLTSKGINHGPCWSTPGAYLVNYGTGKVGDGIDQVPLTGNNPETGNDKSQKFDYPNYIIVVSGKWTLCGDNSCSSTSTPFTHTKSSAYRTSTGGSAYVYGGAYNLCSHSYWWYGKDYPTKTYSQQCSDPNIYIDRI
jgi:hypothetical protein